METTEWEKYYYAGAVRLAMREDSDDPLYLIGDHLGSTSLVLDTSGLEVAKQSYLPFGETWGVSAADLPTDYTFTGQREAAEIGLMYYVARWYDSEIGHFIQADTIIPEVDNSIAWNRFSYVYYSPINNIDPSGRMVDEEGSYNPWNKTVKTDEGVFDLEDNIWIEQIVKISDEFELTVYKRDEINFTTYGGVDIEVVFTWDDILDFYIDWGGITGELIAYLAAISPVPGDEVPGVLLYILTEGMEIPGVTKAIYDTVKGDPSNLLYEGTTSQIDNIIETNANNINFVDYARLGPFIGIFFNLISIAQNVQVDINIDLGSQQK